jgi:hypothetical protein
MRSFFFKEAERISRAFLKKVARVPTSAVRMNPVYRGIRKLNPRQVKKITTRRTGINHHL